MKIRAIAPDSDQVLKRITKLFKPCDNPMDLNPGKCNPCLERLNQALKLAREHQIAEKQVAILHLMAQCDLNGQHYAEAGEKLDAIWAILGDGAKYDRMSKIHSLQGRLQWVRTNFEDALLHFRIASELARDNGDLIDTAGNRMNMGMLLKDMGRLDESLESLEQAMNGFREAGNLRFYNQAKNSMANLLQAKGAFSEALELKLQCANFFREQDDPRLLSMVLNNLSTIHSAMHRMDKALECSLESLRLREKVGDPLSIATTWMNLGVIYKEINEIGLAREYYTKALDYYTKTGNRRDAGMTLNNLGNCCLDQNEIEPAREYFHEAIEVARQTSDLLCLATATENLGVIVMENDKNPQAALELFRKAEEYSKQSGNTQRILEIRLNLLDCLIQQGDPQTALEQLPELESKFREAGLAKGLYRIQQLRIDAFTALGDDRSACEAFHTYCKERENFHQIENRERIAEMQTRYETERKEREAELLRQRAMELEEKNREIEAQKVQLQQTLDQLHDSEIRYHFVTEELNRNIRTTLIGKSEAIRKTIEMISLVAGSENINVLITGETGTGKEIVARNIHACSARSKMPFYAVNCSAIPDTLFESQFFGHEKDAFTGAHTTKMGWFEIAGNSTLFLDEIGTLSPDQQAKLLRALEERTIVRVGSHREIPVDVRLISATNSELLDQVKNSGFRRDLYHRLAVFVIHLPPLRERREEIPLLLEHFVGLSASARGKAINRIEKSIVPALMEYDFPGNVRELKNMVERAVLVTNSSVLRLEDFLIPIREFAPPVTDEIVPLDELERRMVVRALRATGFNRVKAAKLLQVERKAVERKIAKYNISPVTD
jgi:DNA-binding NtrC family response regulator/Flp pilus assembly protein TadD